MGRVMFGQESVIEVSTIANILDFSSLYFTLEYVPTFEVASFIASDANFHSVPPTQDS